MDTARRLLGDRDVVAELKLAVKTTVAGTLSWWLCTRLGEPRPLFATLVPLVAMSGDPFNAVSVSIARILGVFAGVGIAIALLSLSLGTLTAVALALIAGTLSGIVLRLAGRVNVQAAVSALFLIGLSKTGATQVGVARIWETAVGAGVTIAVSALLWPPDPVRELRLRLGRLRQELAGDLAAVAEDLATGSGAAADRLDDVRAHSLDAVREVLDLERARSALRWNPIRRPGWTEFPDLEKRIHLAARLYRHARSIARDVADAGRGVRGSPAGVELAAAARDVAELGDAALVGRTDDTTSGRAAARLAAIDGNAAALVIAMQLRQMLDDVELLRL
ncbi:MAG TPA: FUSC family protein [Gaiellaceae bacterium]|jgi:uncharacterized membrane protein YgaE (UPF0421/DUF939 family)